MNPRFEELYKSCRPKEALASQEQFQSANVLLGTEVEKFAELIVKECLEQVRDEVQYEYDWKLADAVSKRVLEHFGVEE